MPTLDNEKYEEICFLVKNTPRESFLDIEKYLIDNNIIYIKIIKYFDDEDIRFFIKESYSMDEISEIFISINDYKPKMLTFSIIDDKVDINRRIKNKFVFLIKTFNILKIFEG